MPSSCLGDVAKFINGAAFKPEDWGDAGLPIIRIQNLTGSNKQFNYTTRTVKPDLHVKRGDMLVSWSATLDVFVWDGPEGLLNQHIFKVIPNSNVDRRFLFHTLKSKIAELNGKTHGSTMKHVVRGDFEGTVINLPPLDEQQRIADILDRAASIQRLRQAADEKLKQIIPALFVDMFGDPASNPKGWPMTTVGDLIESADYGSSAKAHDEATGLPMLRMGNVTIGGALDLKNLKYVELEPAEQAKCTLRKGDILFNRTNSKELVGKTGIWDGSCDAVFASYFIRLRTKPDVMTAEVLWAFMNSKHTKGLLFGMARGAIGQSNINSKELRAIRLFAPPIALQERFSQLYYDLKAKAEMSTAATTAAKSIAASLANDIFSAA